MTELSTVPMKHRHLEHELKVCALCKRPLPRGWYSKDGHGKLASRCRTCRRGKNAGNSAKRRALLAAPGAGAARRVTEQDLRELFREHVKRYGYACRCTPECEETLLNGYHWDHRVALAKGGQHVRENLRPVAPRCNLLKGAK